MPIHYPGYNYCGPGTRNFSKRPRNRLDAACRRHDKGYKSNYDYILWNDADEEFLRALEENKEDDPRAAKIMRNLFEFKKALNQVTLGQVTGSKRYGGKITDWAKPSKIRRVNKEPLDSNVDSNGIGRNQRTSGTEENDPDQPSRAMPKRYRRIKGRRKTGRKTSRNRYNSKRNSNNRKNADLNRKIARVLNPTLEYEHQEVDAARMTASFCAKYMMLFDPTYYVNNTTSGAGTSHGLGELTTIISAINVTTGDALSSTDYGKQYWIMKQMDKYRVTNMTSGVLFFKVHYMKCIAACSGLIELIENNTLEGTSGLYVNTDTATGGGTATYGSPLGVTSLCRHALPRTMSIDEIKTLKHAWKRVRSYSFKLAPNENHTIKLKRKDWVFDPANYVFGTTTFDYIPGNMKVIIQVVSTVTGSTTGPPGSEPGWDYMSYGLVNVPFEYYSTATISKRTTTQQKRYTNVKISPPAGTSALTATPAIIGDPVQTSGAAQAMAD